MWVFLNGKILRQEEVSISPFDRGFQFSDGVYEKGYSVSYSHALIFSAICSPVNPNFSARI